MVSPIVCSAADAIRVYALDVGYGQIHQRMREDERVVVMERNNVRLLTELPEPIDIVVIDVSFISLKMVLPAAVAVLKPGGWCVPLIKPQFEAGKGQVGKGGVVRDHAVHKSVLEDSLGAAQELGFSLQGLVLSPLTGPAGNIEFLAALKLSDEPSIDIQELIESTGMET